MSATGRGASAEEYFRSIETVFLRLRGAPLLLSPADWKTAERWYDAGIPLSVVQDVMESVFERLRERDPKRRISSLTYCAPAVEEAWREIEELSEPTGRLEPVSLDIEERLKALIAALPRASTIAAEIGPRLADLAGSAEVVERALQGLDVRMLDMAEEELDEATRERLEARTRVALDRALGPDGSEREDDLERRRRRRGPG